ncbi:Fe-S cluster assembly protein SufD [Dyella sp.]|uniref:Fe-S cluster assembly protein SufD n=1 Tax=Dyella sp. TaxID=1869338 RepID=UPI0039C8B066
MLESLLEAPLPQGAAWLDVIRRENLDALAAHGLPDSRHEAWKYTALRGLAQRRFHQGDALALTREVDAGLLQLPGIDGPRLVFVNGAFRADLSRLDDLPDGLEVLPLSRALAQDDEPLRFALSQRYRDVADAFAQLNIAYATDGVVLRVAAGARIDAPLQLSFLGAEAGELAWHLRHVIALGDGAQLSLVEHHAGLSNSPQLVTSMADIVLGEGARLQMTVLQQAASEAALVRRTGLQLGVAAHATMHVAELGGGLVRHDLYGELKGDGARLDTRGVFALRGRQHVDTQLALRHDALATASESLWRGVADQRARGVFRGAIVVAEGADGSDASLSNKNLLLSAQAEIDTKPELEIYADEVKAAHGATVGQLDERALFYLRSRGIALAQARTLLTAAFCRAVLADIPHEPLRDHISDLLLAQLPADVSA